MPLCRSYVNHARLQGQALLPATQDTSGRHDANTKGNRWSKLLSAASDAGRSLGIRDW